METSSPYRPRVSRETRLLLIAGVLAVAALWLLARIRFPERDVSPNPLPSVLSQLASGPKYDDLAGETLTLRVRRRGRTPRGGLGGDRPRGAARQPAAWSYPASADEDRC